MIVRSASAAWPLLAKCVRLAANDRWVTYVGWIPAWAPLHRSNLALSPRKGWCGCVWSGQPVKEPSGPRLAYRIAIGVRYTDQEWKRQLNRTIQENQPAINRLLLSFGVPLLDDKDRAITEDSIPK